MKKIKVIITISVLTMSFCLVLVSMAQEKWKSWNWADYKPNARFAIFDPGTPTDDGDDLIMDKENGFVWARNANLAGKVLLWEDAINYCQELVQCNFKGWGLPTKEELSSLIDPSQDTPALPKGHPFVNVKHSYWTSTTHEDPALSENAYCVHISSGDVRPFAKVFKFYVWPVMRVAK